MFFGRPFGLRQQFLRLVCDELWSDSKDEESALDDIDSLDDACGAGTSELDLSAEDYATIIGDAVRLLEPTADLIVPADDIDTVCQVRVGRGNTRM